MRPPLTQPCADPNAVETKPPSELTPEPATPVSDSWDSEAPTVVCTRRPPFAGPPPLPRT